MLAGGGLKNHPGGPSKGEMFRKGGGLHVSPHLLGLGGDLVKLSNKMRNIDDLKIKRRCGEPDPCFEVVSIRNGVEDPRPDEVNLGRSRDCKRGQRKPLIRTIGGSYLNAKAIGCKAAIDIFNQMNEVNVRDVPLERRQRIWRQLGPFTIYDGVYPARA